MKTYPTQAQFLSSGVNIAVNAYLLARAAAETMRAEVDKVYLAVLTSSAGQLLTSPSLYDKTPQRSILTQSDMYLSEDEEKCRWVYDEVHIRLVKAGLKKADVEVDICPALVLENLLVQAENNLIDIAGGQLGVTREMLWKADNLKKADNRKKFIDLTVGLVVNSPGYEKPVV